MSSIPSIILSNIIDVMDIVTNDPHGISPIDHRGGYVHFFGKPFYALTEVEWHFFFFEIVSP